MSPRWKMGEKNTEYHPIRDPPDVVLGNTFKFLNIDTQKEAMVMSKKFRLNDLPDVVLINIFEFLNLDSRKEAMMVNKKFRDLLQLNRFERKISWTFEHCKISYKYKPYNVLMNSSRKFYHIAFAGVIRQKDSYEFWCHIGKDVESIKFSYVTAALCFRQMLETEYFPKLKHIEFYEMNQTLYDELTIPKTVETVHIRRLNHAVEPKELKMLKYVKTFTAKSIKDGTYSQSQQMEMKLLLKWGVFNFDINPKLNLLEEDIKCMDIQYFGTLYRENIYFSYKFIREQIPKFKNLMELKLITKKRRCFFLHETVIFQSIKKISLKIKSNGEYCDDCLNNLVNSCPNLESWSIEGSPKRLEALLDKTPKPLKDLVLKENGFLEHFNLKYPHLEYLAIHLHDGQSNKINFESWVEMPNLKVISFGRTDCDISLKNLKIIAARCPTVTCATLCKVTPKKLEIIQEHWPYLKYLYYTGDNHKLWDYLHVNSKFRSLRRMQSMTGLSVIPYEVFVKIPTLRDTTIFVYNFNEAKGVVESGYDDFDD